MNVDQERGSSAPRPLPAQAAGRASVARRRARAVVLALVLGLFATGLVFEALARLAFASPDLPLGALGRWLRRPDAYADGNGEDDHWKLVCRLGGPRALEPAPNPDRTVGWTGYRVAPGTYAHQDEQRIGDRRVVLLYGDSFAECATPVETCFQTLLEQSDLGATHALLNYGVGGFGLDQSLLLLKNSIDRHADRRPIVVFSLLVESDFDRAVLGFRCWPKPRFELADGELVPRAPDGLSVPEYLENHPVTFPSYGWRRFLYQQGDFLAAARARWRGDERRAAQKRELGERILAEVAREVESRGIECFVLAFHAEEGALQPFAEMPWRDELLARSCAASGLRLVDTRAFLIEASGGDPAVVAGLYGHGAPLYGHHNALGNRVCFEAIRHGVLGRRGPPDPERFTALRARGGLDPESHVVEGVPLLGRVATLSAADGDPAQRVVESRDPARLVLRGDAAGRTSATIHLDGSARRFSGRLHALTGANESCSNQVLRCIAQVDERVVFDGVVPDPTTPTALDIPLDGARTLTLALSGWRGPGSCSWVAVSDPRLE